MRGRKSKGMKQLENWYETKYKTSKTQSFIKKKPKFHYRRTYEVGTVREEHISQSEYS
jgi:hypothetical protein